MIFNLNNLISKKSAHVLLITLALTVAAAFPRFYGLGSLGFYGDEETTSIPARSLAEGQGAKMPSGMPYRRALPHTWLNALSAQVFGLDNELSYRIPAALLGTLTIPFFFLLARPMVGETTAFIAALLLALSEWHILTSREARMYAPFLFFYVTTVFSAWQWSCTGKKSYLVAAIILFCANMAFHTLGIIAAGLILIPIAFIGWSKVSPLRLSIFAVLSGALAHLYSKYFISPPYQAWVAKQPPSIEQAAIVEKASNFTAFELFSTFPGTGIIGVVVGGSVGLWMAKKCPIDDSSSGALYRRAGLFGFAAATGALAFSGHIYGAILASLLFFLIHPEGAIRIGKKIQLPASIILTAATVWSATAIWQWGFIAGIKKLIAFPFPYLAHMALMLPGLISLVIGMWVYLALRAHHREEYPLRACLLASILPIAMLGMVSKWGGIRYLIESYPFLLIVGASALTIMLTALMRKIKNLTPIFIPIAATCIVLSGIFGGHGIPQAVYSATIQYGDPFSGSYTYPDHQAAGRFVRERLTPLDIVVAEDALQQYWYVGRVDYWLRNPLSHREYLYGNSSRELRDIYVSSIVASPEVLTTLQNMKDTRIWVITSGETHGKHDYYLSADQNDWLEKLEATSTPVFIGRDAITKVYCLNCLSAKRTSNKLD